MKIEQLVENLCEGLGIKQIHLAALLDVSSEAITRARNDVFDPEAKTKIMRRLDALTYAIYPLLQEPINPITRLSAVKSLAYEDINGNLDSVVSAIKQDKYQKELLQIIAKNAFEKIRSQKRTEDKFLQEYAQIQASSVKELSI